VFCLLLAVEMSDRNGWIRLHRKIQDNPLWKERRVFSKAEAWIDILMEARHDEQPENVLIGSHLIACNRGECVKSLDTWARRWGWNKSKTRRFFDLLQDMNQIRHESATKTTRISVCNYDTYNTARNDNETQMKRKRNASETHSTPNKNEKNEKNERISSSSGDSLQVELVSMPIEKQADIVEWIPCTKPKDQKEASLCREITYTMTGAKWEYGIPQEWCDAWREVYPNVLIEQTLIEIRQKIIDKGKWIKTPKGIRGFVGGWMAREQNGAR
jgi:hypothetical protein